jgi:hypothetical protein
MAGTTEAAAIAGKAYAKGPGEIRGRFWLGGERMRITFSRQAVAALDNLPNLVHQGAHFKRLGDHLHGWGELPIADRHVLRAGDEQPVARTAD